MDKARQLDDRVVISLQVEHFLSCMFGKRYTHGLRGFMDRRTWKKYVKKILSHLRGYIRANIISDGIHQSGVETAFNEFASHVESEVPNPEMFILSIKLYFMLIGEYPDHWSEHRVLNRPKSFVLGRFRRVIYSQTPHQLAYLLFHQLSEKDDLKREYFTFALRADYAGYIKLFRATYPENFTAIIAGHPPRGERTNPPNTA